MSGAGSPTHRPQAGRFRRHLTASSLSSLCFARAIAAPAPRRGARALRSVRYANRLPFHGYGELVRLHAAAAEKEAELSPERRSVSRARKRAESLRRRLEVGGAQPARTGRAAGG